MPYDPALPANGTDMVSAEMRSQFQGLKSLIDLVQSINAAQVDGVTTGNPGDPAAVSITVNGTTLHFTITLPRGDEGLPGIQGIPGNDGGQGIPGTDGAPGADGNPGEVTTAALDSAISGTSSNTNGVATLGLTVSDPPTQGEMQSIAHKLDEFILAGRR